MRLHTPSHWIYLLLFFADSVIRMSADKIHVLASEKSWVKSILDMIPRQ